MLAEGTQIDGPMHGMLGGVQCW